MNERTYPATIEHLEEMIGFVMGESSALGCPEGPLAKVNLAVEEILMNVINHAYPGGEGDVRIRCGTDEKGRLVVEVSDQGAPFDPLSIPEPDVHLPIEQRKIGGLGIHLVKQTMDEVYYRREPRSNVLTMIKRMT